MKTTKHILGGLYSVTLRPAAGIAVKAQETNNATTNSENRRIDGHGFERAGDDVNQ